VLALAASIALAMPAPSSAQDTSAPGSTAPRTTREEVPAAHNLSRVDAIGIAERAPDVGDARESHGKLTPQASFEAPGTWQVDFRAGGTAVVQVLVDDPSASVRESWTGHQVAWQMARGYPGAFGHALNAPYVWLPLAAIFLLGLIDWRRPLRWVHLDLLVLLSFGVSNHFLTRAEIGLSVPLAYPPMLYLLCRMLWIGLRGRRVGLRPSAPVTWLAVATVFLLGFRVALNIADSGVIDVGYAGVIGADRLTHGDALYGEDAFPDDNPFGDTYGPANYLVYVPFELAAPWEGEWDDLPAAHGASIFFDLVTVGGLFVLGRRLRPGRGGRDLGVIMAFAWTAYPYTAYALQSNANDSLIAALLVWTLVLFARPLARGGLLAVAVMVKFAPLALAPLFAAGERGLLVREDGYDTRSSRVRVMAGFALAFAAASALLLAQPAIDPGLATFWERTVENQLDRASPFSVWGQEPGLEWLQTALKTFAVGLAVLVAFVPWRRDLVRIAALAAAVLIAVQLPAEHWFYLYIPWFYALVIVAICGPAGNTALRCGRPASAPGRSILPARRR
jgi:hypothetical protein